MARHYDGDMDIIYTHVVIETEPSGLAFGHLFTSRSTAVLAIGVASGARRGNRFDLVPLAPLVVH